MADVAGILAGMGLGPGNTSVTQVRRVPTARTKVSPAPTVSKKKTASQPAYGVGFGSPSGGGGKLPVVDLDLPVSHTPDDDGFGWGDVGGLFLDALKIVDKPRALVLAAGHQAASSLMHDLPDSVFGTDKELDANGFDSKWTGKGGILDNTAHNKGAGEYLQEAGMDNALNARAILGFGLDAVSDPLTYLSVGGSRVAEEAGHVIEPGLKAAVEHGGRNAIAKSLVDVSERAYPASRIFAGGTQGVYDAAHVGAEEILTRNVPKEVDALIAEAGQRGRGALTKKGLERAGITAEQEAALGLPKFGVGVLGSKALPGTSMIAEAIENGKGALKAAVGGTKAAEVGRRLMGTEAWGQRKLINIIRDPEASVATRADAVRVLSTANQAQADAYGWVTRKINEVFHKDSELNAAIVGAKPGDYDRWINNIETGAATEGPDTLLQGFFGKTLKELQDHGVEVAERENYVPHMVTSEARKLAETNADVRLLVDSVGKREGFQQAREATGTILEQNAKFMTKYGVKLLETDPKALVTRYMADATDAIGRATQANMLKKMGLAEIIPEYAHTARVAEDDLAQVVKLRDKANVAAKARADVIIHTREEQAAIARDALNQRIEVGRNEVRRIDTEVKDLTRKANQADKALEKAQRQLDSHNEALAEATKIVKSQRGGPGSPMQKAARAKVKEMTEKIAAKEAEIKVARDRVANIMNNYEVNGVEQTSLSLANRARATKGFTAEVKRLGETRQTYVEALAADTEHLEALKLKNSPPGAGPTLADQTVQAATAQVEASVLNHTAATTAADIASNSHYMAVADQRVVTAAIDDANKRIKDALGEIVVSRNPKKLATKLELAESINESLGSARKILEETNDPAVEILARLDVTAALSDAETLRTFPWEKAPMSSSEQYHALKAQVEDMKNSAFRPYMQQEVTDGWTAINSKWQIPDWIDSALEVKSMMKEDQFWKDTWNIYNKTLNTFKGYLIARPAFVVRNAYASAFNVYLEGGLGALESVWTYRKFHHMFEENPTGYIDDAIAKWGDDMAMSLENARKSAAATGAGQSADEVAHGLIGGTSKNPLDPNFAPIAAVRRGSADVESIIRGGHAFDVLQRGGTVDLAVDTVNRWHFNYRDITNADRKIKSVAMPFWLFFSRNMALQATTLASSLPRLNRSYFNLQRNLGIGSSPDENVPDYFRKASGIRLPGGDANSPIKYLFPDVSPNQFISDLQSIQDSNGTSLIGQANPFLKVPAELAAGKQFFNGSQFQDWNSPRETPFYMDAPGVSGILNGLGVTKTGGSSGDQFTTDRARYIIENALPVLGQGARMDNGSDIDGLLSWLGVSVKTNTPEMRAADVKSKAYAAAQQRREDKKLAGK